MNSVCSKVPDEDSNLIASRVTQTPWIASKKNWTAVVSRFLDVPLLDQYFLAGVIENKDIWAKTAIPRVALAKFKKDIEITSLITLGFDPSLEKKLFRDVYLSWVSRKIAAKKYDTAEEMLRKVSDAGNHSQSDINRLWGILAASDLDRFTPSEVDRIAQSFAEQAKSKEDLRLAAHLAAHSTSYSVLWKNWGKLKIFAYSNPQILDELLRNSLSESFKEPSNWNKLSKDSFVSYAREGRALLGLGAGSPSGKLKGPKSVRRSSFHQDLRALNRLARLEKSFESKKDKIDSIQEIQKSMKTLKKAMNKASKYNWKHEFIFAAANRRFVNSRQNLVTAVKALGQKSEDPSLGNKFIALGERIETWSIQ